jgi:hypothetical protein
MYFSGDAGVSRCSDGMMAGLVPASPSRLPIANTFVASVFPAAIKMRGTETKTKQCGMNLA